MSGQRVLVTGATGFIGRHLVPSLVQEGHVVDVVMRPGAAPLSDTGGGRTFSDLALEASELDGVQTVFHLAGLAHEGVADASPAAFEAVNVAAPLNLLRASAAAGVPRFVFLSSIKVLGDVTTRPFAHTDPCRPGDAYARSKAAAEAALRAEAKTGTRLAIVRPPLVYGAGVTANFFALLKLGLSGWPLPLGAALAPRAWLGVNNLVALLLKLGAAEDPAGIWHVRDCEERSVCQMLRTIAQRAGTPGRLFPIPPRLLLGIGALLGRRAAAERLVLPLQVNDQPTRAALAWSPPHRQDDELDRVISWFRQR